MQSIGAGEDGLIVVHTESDTGVFYYLESSGAGIAASELRLLAIVDDIAVPQAAFLLV